MCKTWLPSMHKGSFGSPKLGALVVEDGQAFLRRTPAGSFDAAIVDGVDFTNFQARPQVPDKAEAARLGNGLFQSDFYAALFRAMRPGGAVAQYIGEREATQQLLRQAGFNHTLQVGVDIP